MTFRTAMPALLAMMTTLPALSSGCAAAPEPRPRDWSDNTKYQRPTADWIQEDKLPPRYRISRHPRYSELIRDGVRREGRKIQRCYVTELDQDPQLHGELTVQFHIGQDGLVQDAQVDFSSLSSPALEPCVLEVFKALKLPPPPKPGFKVRYPLVFTSEETPPEIIEALQARYHLERDRKAEENARKSDDYKAPW